MGFNDDDWKKLKQEYRRPTHPKKPPVTQVVFEMVALVVVVIVIVLVVWGFVSTPSNDATCAPPDPPNCVVTP